MRENSWRYYNPVKVEFGEGRFDRLPAIIAGRRYAVVTYPERFFGDRVADLAEAAGAPHLVVDDVAPNPDYVLLGEQSARFAEAAEPVEVIVAIGGGSVIDTAKVVSAAGGRFDLVRRWLARKEGLETLSAVPIIAVPTTAGTGSEVTCWATVWDRKAGRKHSLALPSLYPETALVDPVLTLRKPRALTLSTGLDSLSHALESIWNINANPVSARFAVDAASEILACLPRLVRDLGDRRLRTRLAKSSLLAGLAFSNTKTAIAHNLSYPITLNHDVAHGIACSFTLPAVLMSVADIGGFRRSALQAIFGDDLTLASQALADFLSDLGVAVRAEAYGIGRQAWDDIVEAAFIGERGQNFVGDQSRFRAAARSLQLV